MILVIIMIYHHIENVSTVYTCTPDGDDDGALEKGDCIDDDEHLHRSRWQRSTWCCLLISTTINLVDGDDRFTKFVSGGDGWWGW